MLIVKDVFKQQVKVRLIRPFEKQKALFFFSGLLFCSFMFDTGLARASNNQLLVEQQYLFNKTTVSIANEKVDRAGTSTDSCTLESIEHKQRYYKKERYSESFYLPDASDRKRESTGSKPGQITAIGFKVIAKTPHDINAYTQGLVYHLDYLYESTGGLGTSEIRKIDLATGQVINRKQLANNFFAEGLTLVDKQLIQITLKKNIALVYDINDFKVIDQFEFPGDGWGIVALDNNLLISDGSSILRRINIKNYQLSGEHQVTVNGNALEGINEMENINGMIYANIWPTDCIAVIDTASYQVVAFINLTGLYPEDKRLHSSSVLNGIAYVHGQDKLLVTGKYWPQVYHLKLNGNPGRLLQRQGYE